MEGVYDDNPNSLYYVDFSQENSVVWAQDCRYYESTPTSSQLTNCNAEPVLTESVFDPTGLLRVSPYDIDKEASGFTMEGTYYLSEICLEAYD